LGRSIARALNRKFVRISLGGIRDEAEIRGHRRTYIGSMPGKIVQYMKRAGTVNPVMLLDEIDKMSADFRGDPSSAMLEVLDPEQNHTFNDHYLDVDYDLSKVMFITTANVRYNIPLPLQDRMEIIELSSYLDYEKLQIAKRHIIPKQILAHGLEKSSVSFTDKSIEKLINEYTREAGVRNLEREIASVLRKTAKEIVSNNRKKNRYEITPELIEKFLGVPKFRKTQVEIKSQIGTAIGLAWTSVGGDILQVDASIMKGSERLILTGQLGEVMKESAQAALSYLRANSKQLGLKENSFTAKDIHIHLPAGAIPKDGPSAGITMACAMYSALSNKLPKKNIAMTGEITLRGNILAIGGLNEKLLAAKRYGINTVIIPKENEIDLQEIKDEIKSGLKILKISTIGEAIKILFKSGQ
ncbi:MAG: endopeptidase La, partial [Ignavibacteriales bacterium]|nr:endopeptidase La [Ignavibacteriales bacterium]